MTNSQFTARVTYQQIWRGHKLADIGRPRKIKIMAHGQNSIRDKLLIQALIVHRLALEQGMTEHF